MKRKRKVFWLPVCLLMLAFGLLGVSGGVLPGRNSFPPSDITTDGTVGEGKLEVHFLDVGQGDCTLVVCDGEAMLIDAGDNDKGTKIQSYLQKQGVKELKYVICTHPDADHIGGMDVIIYKFPCETILMTEEEKDTDTYRDVIRAIKEKGYRQTRPVVGAQYALGDAEFTLLGPVDLDSDSNNNSIVVYLKYGNNSFLFTGDAEEKEEADLLEGGFLASVDVYKAGHHGSSSSSSKQFLEEIRPVYAVISCGDDNKYGHPHGETLNSLRSFGVSIFRTDEQGTMIASADGEKITWNCSASETWPSGEPMGTGENADISGALDSVKGEEINSSAITYICNIKTYKFHDADCESVAQISEKNKKSVTDTRERLIEQGFQPCKICNP